MRISKFIKRNFLGDKIKYFSSHLQILKEKKHLSPLTFHFSLFTLHSLSPHIIYYYQMENVLMKGYASVPASRCGLCMPQPATPLRQPRTPPSRGFHHYRKYRPNALKLPNTGIKYNHSRSPTRLFVQSLTIVQGSSLISHYCTGLKSNRSLLHRVQAYSLIFILRRY